MSEEKEVKRMESGKMMGAVLGAVVKAAAAILVIFLLFKGADVCYDYGYRIFAEPAMTEGEGTVVTVNITEDMEPAQIGELFESKGLIRDSGLFVFQYYLSEFRKDVKPGQFELSTAMTVEEMMEVMASGAEEEA